jgi:hypothetical protein
VCVCVRARVRGLLVESVRWAKHVVNAYGGKDLPRNNNTYHVPQKESEATCLQVGRRQD